MLKSSKRVQLINESDILFLIQFLANISFLLTYIKDHLFLFTNFNLVLTLKIIISFGLPEKKEVTIKNCEVKLISYFQIFHKKKQYESSFKIRILIYCANF